MENNRLFMQLEEQIKSIEQENFHNQHSNPNGFVSSIKVHGTSILPPAMTAKRRNEMMAWRTRACELENSRKAKSVGEKGPQYEMLNSPDESDTQSANLISSDTLQNVVLDVNVDKYDREGGLLDSLTRDLMSIEDGSLPTEFAGLPLTSTRQQHIIHTLSKLSKTLNIGDGLTATGFSDDSEFVRCSMDNSGQIALNLEHGGLTNSKPDNTELPNVSNFHFSTSSTGLHDIPQLTSIVSPAAKQQLFLPSSNSPTNQDLNLLPTFKERSGSEQDEISFINSSRPHNFSPHEEPNVSKSKVKANSLLNNVDISSGSEELLSYNLCKKYNQQLESHLFLNHVSFQNKSDVNLDNESSCYSNIKHIDPSCNNNSEADGKADHINRYLDNVCQYLADDGQSSKVDSPSIGINSCTYSDDLNRYSKTFAKSLLPNDWKTIAHLSNEDIIKMQNEHFDHLREDLMEQQKKQLEDLFHQQKYEQLQLQKELEFKSLALQTKYNLIPSASAEELIQNNELLSQVDKNKKISASLSKLNNLNAVGKDEGLSKQFSPKVTDHPHIDELERTQPKAFYDLHFPPGVSVSPNTQAPTTPDSFSVSERDGTESNKNLPGSYPYVPSPSHLIGHLSNESLLSTLNTETPKRKLFDNFIAQPKQNLFHRKPVQRSPLKNVNTQAVLIKCTHNEFTSRQLLSFNKVTALAKGFLTRCLMKSDKVQYLIRTIKDTRDFEFSFHTENRSIDSHQDQDLLERIIAQLQAALIEIHEIFFVIPVSEQMALLSHTRQVREEKNYRKSLHGQDYKHTNKAHHRLSMATYKSMERKRRFRYVAASENVTSTVFSAQPIYTATKSKSRSNADKRMPNSKHKSKLKEQNGVVRNSTGPKKKPQVAWR